MGAAPPPPPSFAPTMKRMNRKNNGSKSSNFEVFPSENRKCFFVIEDEFQKFEKKFLQNQLRKRTDFTVSSIESVDAYGIEFLIWFTRNIQGDMTAAGESLAHIIHCKLKSLYPLRSEYTDETKKAILKYVENMLK